MREFITEAPQTAVAIWHQCGADGGIIPLYRYYTSTCLNPSPSPLRTGNETIDLPAATATSARCPSQSVRLALACNSCRTPLPAIPAALKMRVPPLTLIFATVGGSEGALEAEEARGWKREDERALQGRRNRGPERWSGRDTELEEESATQEWRLQRRSRTLARTRHSTHFHASGVRL